MTAKRGLFRRNLGNPGCREEIGLSRRSCASEWSAGFLLEDFTSSCETSGDTHTKHLPLGSSRNSDRAMFAGEHSAGDGWQMQQMSPRISTRENRFTLRNLVAPFFRRKHVLIPTFLALFALAATLGWLRFHTYPSHLAIQVSPNTPALTDQQIHTEAERLKSRDLLQQVALANGLQKARGGWLSLLPPQQTDADRLARAVRALQTHIEVDVSSKSNRMEVTYRSPDPALAYGVLHSLGALYLKQQDARQSQSYQAALADAEAGLRAVAGNQPAQSLPAKSFDEAALEREAKADEQNYLRYLSRREQERSSGALDSTPAAKVAIAVPPAIPTQPAHGPLSILLIALALAVLISLAATCIIDFFDHSFHTPAQVIDLLGVPVVVAVARRTA